jgi:choline dehydrogenase-like flavoprotein
MASAIQNLDAVVIGAGFSGLHMLKSLRDKSGLKVRVYEAGETVGGTWYWNRYPGAMPTFIASPGTSSSCKSGNGPNAIPSSTKSFVISSMLPNATTSNATFNSIPA